MFPSRDLHLPPAFSKKALPPVPSPPWGTATAAASRWPQPHNLPSHGAHRGLPGRASAAEGGPAAQSSSYLSGALAFDPKDMYADASDDEDDDDSLEDASEPGITSIERKKAIADPEPPDVAKPAAGPREPSDRSNDAKIWNSPLNPSSLTIATLASPPTAAPNVCRETPVPVEEPNSLATDTAMDASFAVAEPRFVEKVDLLKESPTRISPPSSQDGDLGLMEPTSSNAGSSDLQHAPASDEHSESERSEDNHGDKSTKHEETETQANIVPSPCPSVSGYSSSNSEEGGQGEVWKGDGAQEAQGYPAVSVTALSSFTSLEAEDDYRSGRRLLKRLADQSRRQQLQMYTLAVKRLESAAGPGQHPEAMKLLAETVYGKMSPLSNASKANEWIKRRTAYLETPEGMMAQATFLYRAKVLEDDHEGTESETLLAKRSPSPCAATSKFIATHKVNPKEGECMEYIRRAADLGHPAAFHELGLFLWESGKQEEAISLLLRAAATGKSSASDVWLSKACEAGVSGISNQDVSKARAQAKKVLAEERNAGKKQAASQHEHQESAGGPPTSDAIKLIEAEAAMRIANDSELRIAIRNMEWGHYTTGVAQVHRLATTHRNQAAQLYLNPDLSTVPSTKAGAVIMFHIGAHHAAHGDPVTAVKWFRKSATAGYQEGMLTYAAYLVVGKGLERPDPGQTMVWLMKCWDSFRSKEAALALGEAYTKGLGVPPDPSKAVKWYMRAWDAGFFPEAAFAVGLAYATGYTPGAVDPAEWSEAQGSELAVGDIVNEVLVERIVTPSKSATSTPENDPAISSNPEDTPEPPKPSRAAPKPYKPAKPMTIDKWRAGFWYRRAIEQGNHVRACNNLGEMYMTGKGVVRDDVAGFNLFSRAARAGLPEAEYNIGRCYRDGRGCKADEDRAVLWFKKAEANGKLLAWRIPPTHVLTHHLGIKQATIALSHCKSNIAT
ncbi:hypothetical protein DFJ73DRAFT_831747 [Zopfochytrium polystomum]|nr:hypothetical protein DFJ73DRAFT_831747 [Zopfochytrium polystomum]